MIVYGYEKCSTCRKAYRWLDEAGIDYQRRPIRDTPPSAVEIRQVLAAVGERRRLLNTSSKDYRDGGWKDRLAEMDEAALISALRGNGNLIKRPFVVWPGGGSVGFQPELWAAQRSGG